MTRSVLVTGASSGIGEACVARFHADGWRVVATVRRTEDGERLRAQFAGITVLVVDLTRAEDVVAVIGDEFRRSEGIDVVVNNAGASIIAAVEELTLEDFRAQMNINLFAAIQVAQLALPFMRARGFGRIVQVSSGFGRIALPMFAAYCASKFALEGFSEALAHEVAPFGIAVSLVEPGTVRTRFDANRREGGRYDENGTYAPLYRAMRPRLAASHARGPSSASDVAAVIFSAATANRPALRHTVGGMGMLAGLAARWLPDAVKSAAVARMLSRQKQ